MPEKTFYRINLECFVETSDENEAYRVAKALQRHVNHDNPLKMVKNTLTCHAHNVQFYGTVGSTPSEDDLEERRRLS